MIVDLMITIDEKSKLIQKLLPKSTVEGGQTDSKPKHIRHRAPSTQITKQEKKSAQKLPEMIDTEADKENVFKAQNADLASPALGFATFGRDKCTTVLKKCTIEEEVPEPKPLERLPSPSSQSLEKSRLILERIETSIKDKASNDNSSIFLIVIAIELLWNR